MVLDEEGVEVKVKQDDDAVYSIIPSGKQRLFPDEGGDWKMSSG